MNIVENHSFFKGYHVHDPIIEWRILHMCCDVLQCVAVCCSVLQCVAVCCSVLQCACLENSPHGDMTRHPSMIGSCGLSRPRAPHQNFILNTENNCLNKMALGHWGQFDKTYGNVRAQSSVSMYVNIRAILLLFTVNSSFKNTRGVTMG